MSASFRAMAAPSAAPNAAKRITDAGLPEILAERFFLGR
jgi:hypothetical protein